MPSDGKLYIRLLREGYDADGEHGYYQVGEDYELAEFGGVLPAIGDIIISPYYDDAIKHAVFDPEKRTVHEVVARYFRPLHPDKSGFNAVVLVVKSRSGRKEERHPICGKG